MIVGLFSGCFKVLFVGARYRKTQVSIDEAHPLTDLRDIRWLDDSAPNGGSVNRILRLSGTESNPSSDDLFSRLEI